MQNRGPRPDCSDDRGCLRIGGLRPGKPHGRSPWRHCMHCRGSLMRLSCALHDNGPRRRMVPGRPEHEPDGCPGEQQQHGGDTPARPPVARHRGGRSQRYRSGRRVRLARVQCAQRLVDDAPTVSRKSEWEALPTRSGKASLPRRHSPPGQESPAPSVPCDGAFLPPACRGRRGASRASRHAAALCHRPA